jgi:8-oxo-dGTP pyrophosphatase MutT (NUDIX family)
MRNISTFSQFINEGLEIKVSAGLAIIWEGKVLLAHTTGRNFKTGYGIPKGGIEKGETHLDAAIRETSEEIGINIPRSLVSSNSYQFGVDAKKWGYKQAAKVIMVSQEELLSNLYRLGLVK